MKTSVGIFVMILAIAFVFSSEQAIAKTLPQTKSSGKTVIQRASGAGVSVFPKLRRDRQALIVTFGNLQNASTVSYTLVYTTNGREEGAGGSVRPSEGSSASRELLFGTCSKNVCRYHANITNMRLEVISKLKSGKTTTKRFRVKI